MKLLNPLESAVGRLSRYVLKFHYTKLSLFALSIVLAYTAFAHYGAGDIVRSFEVQNDFVLVFLLGAFYSFGFTAPFAAAALVSLEPGTHLWFLAIVGGLGGVAADWLLLKFVRVSFEDEFELLKHTPHFKFAKERFFSHLPEKVSQYLLLAFAGFFIASPLPDEIAVSLLAGFTNIKEGKFALLSFVLSTLGVLLLLLL